jgi:hypothetical protein
MVRSESCPINLKRSFSEPLVFFNVLGLNMSESILLTHGHDLYDHYFYFIAQGLCLEVDIKSSVSEPLVFFNVRGSNMSESILLTHGPV